MLKNDKYIVFDVVRSLCTIWIVGYWHLIDYPLSVPQYSGGYCTTIAVLATFFFLSGLLNGGKEFEAKTFYFNRIKRLYIPYIVALLLTIWQGVQVESSKRFFLYSATGISCFLGHQPRTLWFVTVLFWYYILTPLFRKNGRLANNSLLRMLVIALIMILLVLLFVLCKTFDYRLLLFFPFYMAGLLMDKRKVVSLSGHPLIVFLGVAGIIILSLFSTKTENVLLLTLYSALGVISMLVFGNFLAKIKFSNKMFEWISFSSMFAYLFHRSLYHEILRYYPVDGEWLLVVCPFLLVGSLFLFSWMAQKLYNKILDVFAISNTI